MSLIFALSIMPNTAAAQTGDDAAVRQRIQKLAEVLRSNPDSTIHELRQLLETNSLTEQLKAEALKLKGTGYLMMGKMDSASVAYDEAIAIVDRLIVQFRDVGDTLSLNYFEAIKTKAQSANNKAIMAYYEMRYEDAIKLYDQAANAHKAMIEAPFQQIRNRAIKDYAGTTDNIAVIYNSMEQSDKVLEYRMKAYRTLQSIVDETSVTVAINLAVYYEQLLKTDSVEKYVRKAIREAGDSLLFLKSVGWSMLSAQLIDENKLDSAYVLLKNATPHLEKAGALRWMMPHCRNFAGYYLKRKNYDMAIQWLERGVDYGNSMGTPERIVKVYEMLHEAYLGRALANNSREDFILADRYQTKMSQLSDSLLREQRFKEFNELQTRFETERKEKEIAEKDVVLANTKIELQKQNTLRNALIGIALALGVIIFIIYRNRLRQARTNALLQRTNEEIIHQKQIIEQSLKEKESLLREIHHRVKNNLQVISSLLNMQSYHLDDPGMISAIAEGQSRVKAMALIHQKLYQTDQLTEIDFQEYTEQLIQHLATAFGRPNRKVTSIVKGSDIKLDIDTAIPLGLILNELVTNAYKYAFKDEENGYLQVELSREQDEYFTLKVADNGQGLPQGFDEAKLNSLGLKLVRMLIEQLDGSLTIQNEGGTHFNIRFKETRMSA